MEKNPIYEMRADEYNQKLAEALKQIPEFKEPEWAAFVKTGTAKKRPPQEEDFWHKRAASILRQIYIHKTVGVNRLKTRYGSRKNRGMRPEKFKKGSGKIIRVILQQAEKAGLLEKKNEPGKRAGRCLTEKGKELLENIKFDNNHKMTKSISPKTIKEATEVQNVQELNISDNKENKK